VLVSDFICEKLGYLRLTDEELTDEEFENAKAKYTELKKKNARSYLEYGEIKE